jgi:hypothetical protein
MDGERGRVASMPRRLCLYGEVEDSKVQYVDMKVNENFEHVCEVTQADIDDGLRDDPSYCPIALAIKRSLPMAYPLVQREEFFFVSEEFFFADKMRSGRYKAQPSEEVLAFVRKFDLGMPVRPFTLKLVWLRE